MMVASDSVESRWERERTAARKMGCKVSSSPGMNELMRAVGLEDKCQTEEMCRKENEHKVRPA